MANGDLQIIDFRTAERRQTRRNKREILKMPICEAEHINKTTPALFPGIVQARPVYFLRPEVFFQNHDLVLLFLDYLIIIQCESDLYIFTTYYRILELYIKLY